MVLAYIVVTFSVVLEMIAAYLAARLVKDRSRTGYFYSAALFLGALWLLTLLTYAGLAYEYDGHVTHDHEHAGLEFARGVYENLQSEVWQIWIAAFTFGTAALGAKFFWKGTPESQE